MTRCIILSRISLDKLNLDNQEIVLKQFQEQQGWELIGDPIRLTEHGDVGEQWNDQGELVESRPEIIDLIQRARAKEFDVLLIWKHDRLTRAGGATLVNYARRFGAMGVKIYDFSDKDYIKADKSTDELVTAVNAHGAKAYLEDLKGRTINKMQIIKDTIARKGVYYTKEGKPVYALGQVPHMVGMGKPNKHQMTPAELERVRSLRNPPHCYSLRAIAKEMGCSTTAITTILKETEIPTPKAPSVAQ